MKTGNGSIIAAPLTLTSTVNSEAVLLQNVIDYAIQIVYTGTPTGSFKLQASNDDGQPLKGVSPVTLGSSVVNWTDVPSSSVAVSGAAGSSMWNIQDAGYRWVRVVYVFTSGTGSLTIARVNTKGG